jgi:ABC-type polysaccharide/polyol phosphate transport system ATPase subunit
MNAIEFTDIWEKYRLKYSINGKTIWEELWALKDINFSVQKGEVVGIIGQNGAGKTTLLKLIAGMLMPDRGEVKVAGRVSTLMELGAGFNPEFTGRENIVINSRIYGISDDEILEKKILDIVEFSGLGKFIDAPMKCYSQGMYTRLAFALAIYVDPDILLIDDVLAVGDEEAQRNCIKKIFELKGSGKTITIVSHDMHMINKLCDRVILLDKGNIKKTGTASMVIPYYLDTVGDKNGIAILEKEGLRVVFNNGRLSLFYNNDFITKDEGGYFSFFDNAINSRVSSFNLTWRIKSILADRIIAEGLTCEGILCQVWQLRLEDCCLEWLVETKGQPVKDPNLNFILPSNYNKWVSLNENGSFPDFAHKINWQDLELNHIPEGTLGVTQDLENNKSPALVFEVSSENSRIKAFNSGYEKDSRVIQAGALSNDFICVNIRLFQSNGNFNNFVDEKKKNFFLKQQRERARIMTERNLTSGALTLFADEETKSFKILVNNKEISKGKGLYNVFFTQKKWFYPYDGDWEIKRISAQELKLTVNYPSINLVMCWTISANEHNELNFKIEMQIRDGLVITNQDLILELSDLFEGWQSDSEEGIFVVNQYVNDIAPIRLKDCKTNRIILKSKDDSSCRLFFGLTSGIKRHIMSIFKRKLQEQEYSSVNYSSIIPKQGQSLNPGKYTIFEGKVAFGKDIRFEQQNLPVRDLSLNKDHLELVFDQGRARLFFKEKELTSGLSVFTSLRSSGFWLDSYQAIWDVCSKDNDRIVVCGHWPNIPVSQTWQFELADKKTIIWKIDMEVFGELNLELAQANLMLSKDYKDWSIPEVNSGKFMDEYTADYDILPFRFWYGPAGPKGIEARGNLPYVLFKSILDNESFRGIIENTDYLYCARLIQYQKTKFNNVTPAKSAFFEGLIQIDG